MVESKRGSRSQRGPVPQLKRGSDAAQGAGIRKIQHMKRKSTLLSEIADRKHEIDTRILSDSFADDMDSKADENEVQPSRVYGFNCGGRNNTAGSSLNGKKIEWKASFDLPLEELTYPSLQRFEFSPMNEINDETQVSRGVISTCLCIIV